MVRNVTDVDDSILPKARELGIPYLELAASELARFRSDMDALGMRPPIAEPRATESIDGMIDMIERAARQRARVPHARHRVLRRLDLPAVRRALALLARAHGQARPCTRRSPRRPAPPRPARLRALAAVARRRAGVARARSASGGPAGTSSAPSWRSRTSGPTIDLHGGGTDLIFPHHECEIAQSESVTGRAVLALLDALGDGQLRGREDEQVARQPRVRQRPARDSPTHVRSGSR